MVDLAGPPENEPGGQAGAGWIFGSGSRGRRTLLTFCLFTWTWPRPHPPPDTGPGAVSLGVVGLGLLVHLTGIMTLDLLWRL